MSDEATIDALGYWVSRLSARVKKLEDRLLAPTAATETVYPPECCGRGPACGACDPEPVPVPEWRQLVDKWHRDGSHGIGAAGSPLAAVLWLLHHLAIQDEDTYRDDLARIVAVCEAQVGDGWQADPDVDPIPADRRHVDILIFALTYGDPRWHPLGDRAASWLRDITEATS